MISCRLGPAAETPHPNRLDPDRWMCLSTGHKRLALPRAFLWTQAARLAAAGAKVA